MRVVGVDVSPLTSCFFLRYDALRMNVAIAPAINPMANAVPWLEEDR